MQTPVTALLQIKLNILVSSDRIHGKIVTQRLVTNFSKIWQKQNVLENHWKIKSKFIEKLKALVNSRNADCHSV
jgi:hypothetical protein